MKLPFDITRALIESKNYFLLLLFNEKSHATGEKNRLAPAPRFTHHDRHQQPKKLLASRIFGE